MTEPIKPDDVSLAKQVAIPEGVIEVFNELITENWDGRRAVVRQEDAVRLISKKMSVCITEIFERKWIDVEGIYSSAGWKVLYDSPGFNETFESTFNFSKKGV